jgi:hypothetical protein
MVQDHPHSVTQSVTEESRCSVRAGADTQPGCHTATFPYADLAHSSHQAAQLDYGALSYLGLLCHQGLPWLWVPESQEPLSLSVDLTQKT